MSHNIKFSLEYLKNKLKESLNEDTSNYTVETIKELLRKKFEESDFDAIKADIIPFVKSNYNVDNISDSSPTYRRWGLPTQEI